MANIGYIQVVRHCNHLCGFCSNPTSPYTHDFESMRVLVDDFVDRGYFGVILTGGEPTLHPELPKIAEYASERGLHVRMITNGSRLADPQFARDMANAGLKLVHVSVYSNRPEVEAALRGTEGTLDSAYAAVDNALETGIDVNINCVINKLNADHLHEGIAHWMTHHPGVRHFIWNNLDPSMGRAEVNQALFTPRLADFELSLHRAMRMLHKSGRSFRVEKVPLCYMTDFAWASTETRKIVKCEERIVHFLDDKQTVRQTMWGHRYAPGCKVCSVRSICGGLFDRGDGYDPAELHPVFVDRDAIVRNVLFDGSDPSSRFVSMEQWRREFAQHSAGELPRAESTPSADRPRVAEPGTDPGTDPGANPGMVAVGRLTARGQRLYESKRRREGQRVESRGLNLEHGRGSSGGD
jgi:hypothetical protein